MCQMLLFGLKVTLKWDNTVLSTVIYLDDKAGALLGAMKMHSARQDSVVISPELRTRRILWLTLNPGILL
jgi:hypothetical protein